MKLRIMGNSLRIRLSQTEISTLGKDHKILDSIQFPNKGKLEYEIISLKSDKWDCFYGNNKISLGIPQILINNWVTTEMVGFDNLIDLENNIKLSILIEKDFKCLTTRSDEDESDLYPNPLESH